MDKLGVQVDESLTKTASTGKKCPRCGAEVSLHGTVPQCPKCGTAPFEKTKDQLNLTDTVGIKDR